MMRADQASVVARQAPLRQRYSEHPEEALITKRVRTTSADLADPFHVTVRPQNVAHPETPYTVAWDLGLDEAVGGLHDLPNPGDMLCAALAACLDGTVRMIANVLSIDLEDLHVEVTGQVDLRGTLAIDPAVRVGFETITASVHVRAAAGTPPQRLEHLCAGAERLCVDLQTLRDGVDVQVAFDARTTEALAASAG